MTFISLISFSQDSLTITSLHDKLFGHNPRPIRYFKQTIGNYINYYGLVKKTKEIFVIRSTKISHDTAYAFYYANEELLYCEFIIWLNPSKRKGQLFRYYIDKGKIISTKENPQMNGDLFFLLSKSSELFRASKQFINAK